MDETHLDQWTKYLLDHNRKQTTVTAYRSHIRTCMRTLEEGGRSSAPEDIDEDAVRWLQAHMTGREETIRTRLEILGIYMEWLDDRNPTRKADLLWNVTTTKPGRIFVSREDLRAVDRDADVEMHLIHVLGACMGLRRTEISRVSLGDIRDGKLKIHGKGHGEDGRVEYALIPDAVIEAVRAYLPVREAIIAGNVDATEGALLVVAFRGEARRMSSKTIYNRIKDEAREHEIRMTPHSLRRRYATTLYEEKVDLVDIKNLMRHQSVETTVRCYIEPNPERMARIASGVTI